MAASLLTLFQFLQALQQVAPHSAPNSPPARPPQRPPESIAEVGEAVIKCYHPTARFRTVDVMQTPWSRGQQYNADKSVLLLITWDGVVQRGYKTEVALVVRRDELRGVVVNDGARVPYNRNCRLEDWAKVNGSAPQ